MIIFFTCALRAAPIRDRPRADHGECYKSPSRARLGRRAWACRGRSGAVAFGRPV